MFRQITKFKVLQNNVIKRTKYSEKVMDHYSKPRNVGSLDKTKTNVGTGIVGAPACGDVMKLQIEFDEAGGVIKDAKFKVKKKKKF